MDKTSDAKKTQIYSSWGDKLLQHTDVLHEMQVNRTIRPITIQLAPVEACDSDCPFCSVAARPIKQYLPFAKIKQVLDDFKDLGAKSVELTGGGNPLLYRDRETKETINDIIDYAHSLGYDIGIITNSHSLGRWLNKTSHEKINWIRVSLIQLDEGRNPGDYDFDGFPYSKLGFSYIIYDGKVDENGHHIADELSRTKRVYKGTSIETIEKISKLISLHQEIKFVRIAGNCLIKGNNASVDKQWRSIIDKIDEFDKIFIKDIGYDDSPFEDGCYVGMIRPYVAPSPHTDKYNVYACTSHVLLNRTYDENWALCNIDNIKERWLEMNENFKSLGYPYEIRENKGKDWCKSCKFCYYKFNNKLLHTVAHEMPDKNFP